MAVEIPVVIDIDQAFADAAKKVPSAVKPLKSSVEKMTSDLMGWQEKINSYKIDGPQWKNAVKNFQAISQALEVANDKFMLFASNEGSIKQMNIQLASLNRRWEEMGAAQKFTATGALTDDAKKLKAEYSKITEEIARTGKTLAQLEAEERRILEIRKKKRQTYLDENRILNATVKTMNVLQAQERILSSRLSATPIGTKKYQDLAAKLELVRKEIAAADAQARRGGASFRDMGDSAARSATQINATNTALKSQSKILGLLTTYLSGYALIFTGIRFVHNIRETTAELEMQRVALGGILNDADRASELFRQIKAAALKSPFEIKDLVTYTKQLSAYRIETDKLFDVTTRLADVSAGLGVDMNRLILAYGQVRAASVLRGQELRQFTEAGIPLVDLLAEKFRELGREGTTTADVFELISKRAVSFSMIEDIFNDMTDAGGIFYNMQEKQSETLKGQWMKLRDSITIMYDEIGNTETVHNAMSSLIKTANNLTRSWRDVSNWIKTIVATMVTYNIVAKASAVVTNALTSSEAKRLAVTKAQSVAMPKFIASIVGETAAKKASLWVTKRLEIAQYKLATATTLAERAFWKLWATLIANPYAAAAAAVAALGLSIYTMIKNSKEATITIDELEQSISKFNSTAKKAVDVAQLTSLYEELSNTTNRTAEETQKLNRVTNELAKSFPSAISGIDSETGALEINIEKVKELTKAERELELARLKRDEKRARERASELEAEKKQILEQFEAGGRYVYGGATAKGIDPNMKRFVEWTDDEIAKMGDRLVEINAELDPIKKDLEEIAKLDFVGPIQTDAAKAKAALSGWRKVLSDIQDEKIQAGAPQLFSEDDIEKLEGIPDLWKKVKKGIEETKKELDGLRNIQSSLATDDLRKENELAIKLTEKQLDLYEAIKAAFGFVFGKDSGGSYQKDSFITLMEDRIKFMKDFKKGYDDLNKYLSEAPAIEREGEIMLGRGLSLKLDASEQKRAANDLSAWYQEQIDAVVAEMRKKGLKGVDVTEMLSQQIVGDTNRAKMLRDYQKLLQSLWDSKTDFDTSQLKKSLEDSLKRLTDEMKRSETVRNFYQNILDLTGDEDLAASMSVSVYGGLGDEFKDRMQKQLDAAFASLDWTELPDDVWGQLSNAFVLKDFDAILEKINLFPEEWQKVLKQMAADNEKHNADIANDLLKSLQRAKTYSEKRVELAMQTAKRIQQIDEMNVPEETKDQLRKQNAKKEAEDAAKLAYDAFKETPMYVELFANLDRASTSMLRNMRENLLAMKSEWKDLHPRELKELQSRLDELDRQLATKNPFRAMADSIREYSDLSKQASRREVDLEAVTASRKAEEQKKILEQRTTEYEVAVNTFGADSENARLAKQRMNAQKVITDQAIDEAEAAQNTANAYRLAAKHIEDAANALQEWAGYVDTSLDGIGKIVDTFASNDFADTFNIISDGISKTVGGSAKIAVGLAKGVAGIPDIISGIGDFISGVFGTANALKIKNINKKIESQAILVEDLEYSYGRLEKAIANAFGSDYIYDYNKQLENLIATQAAYEKQANLEREKGKKADEEKIREYENSARDTADQIADMRGELAKYFAGTDLTSAAKDFANSWIEAYKEFGSTTDAMKERFQEMVQNMIEQSLGAKIMQSILQPLFDSIDEMAQTGGELSAQEIAQIGQMAPEYIDKINAAMTNLMTQLTANGYNIRQQMGGFTGISRDIAGASEESINGLAAGINTQNFYMSLISQNVASILMAMTGESVEGATGATAPDPYKETMLQYVGSIPQMRDDMNAIRTMLERVIRPNGTTPTHYVSVRM